MNTISFIGCLLPIRVVITLLGFCALVCAYTNRVSISHVITMLVVPHNRTDEHTSEQVCPKEETEDESSSNDVSQIHIHILYTDGAVLVGHIPLISFPFPLLFSDRISGNTCGRSSCRVSFLVVFTLDISLLTCPAEFWLINMELNGFWACASLYLDWPLSFRQLPLKWAKLLALS